jgi:hypothetical protein
VHRGEVAVGKGDFPDLGAVAVDEVDHPVGQPGRTEQRQHQVRDQRGGLGRLPHDNVAEQGGAEGEVIHRGVVEWRHREDETLQRPVVQVVADAVR